MESPLYEFLLVINSNPFPSSLRFGAVVTYYSSKTEGARAGGQSLPFSIDFDRRPYNTLALILLLMLILFVCSKHV